MYLISNPSAGLSLGMSIAFSHGSANALLFGMQVIQQKGFLGFIMWAIPNALCMGIFGWLYHRGIVKAEALNNIVVKFLAILIQITMLIFQMKLLQSYFEPLFQNTTLAYIASTSIALIFVLWMIKHGLIASICTDNWQGWITLGSIALAIAYCAFTQVPDVIIPTSASAEWTWALWATASYVAQIIANLQHWRRAELDETGTAFYWASGIFAVLMTLIGILGSYQIPPEVQLFLIIPVLGLATSTIDSIAVALHECVNKWIGTGLAVLICFLWWALLNENAMFIWNSKGVFNVTAASLILLISLKMIKPEWFKWFDNGINYLKMKVIK